MIARRNFLLGLIGTFTDVITSDDMNKACTPRPRPTYWLNKTKKQALAENNLPSSCCEWDHRIPRCIGGADSLDNLHLQECDKWEQDGNIMRCVGGPAYNKDLVEAKICRMVCKQHKMSLPEAQKLFREWKY